MRWAVLAVAAALLGGCRDQRPCNPNTVMLTITLRGAARTAARIEIQAGVAGTPAVSDGVIRPAGQDQGTVEVDLGGRYLSGAQLTVVATARSAAGGALATAQTVAMLDAGCTALGLTLGEVADADGRDGRDGGPDTRDAGPTDGPLPVDMPPPTDTPLPMDVPIDRPPDLPPDLPPDVMNPCPGACIAGTSMACGMCGMRTCLPSCTWGACMGQGACAPGTSEACGNCSSGRRTCSNSCSWGACMGQMGCQPGTTRPCEGCPMMTQTCSAMCGWSTCNCPMTMSKRVFVTSSKHSGMLGGLMGAHALCTRLANDAGLTGQYRAWLSTATSGPANFMTHNPGPYVLPGGDMVATSWADLTDGTLLRPIDRDQNGMPANPQFVCEGGEVWTNTTIGGTPASANDCTGWFGLAGTSQAGNVKYANSRWTNSGCTAVTCASDMPIYCFEQ